MSSALANRHDILILFDVTQGNPNGDPDAGNMPRIDPNSNRGIVSDVCLKRKVRNYLELAAPERQGNEGNGFSILVHQGAVLNEEISKGIRAAETKLGKNALKEKMAEESMKWLCREFYDVRSFGAVLSTGDDVMKGSAFGQVRGPVQFTFARSYHPITPLEITVTRCAVTKEEDRAKERTMGHKHVVPYALYVAKGYVSPPFAERTGFTQRDLDCLFEALNEMFTHDRSAARGEMVVRGIYDFEHVGTQDPANADQNKREARLGCYHAHKLFEGIKVELRAPRTFPESYADYDVRCEWTSETLPKGVKLHLRHESARPPMQATGM
jgi:CRISPR-associated protein Csd2